MSQLKVCILDYGSGNTGSVLNIFRWLGDQLPIESQISNQPRDIQAATHLVLPGVGAFKSAMEKIKQLIPLPVLKEQVMTKKVPFLGICVGMQALADVGYEFGEHQGLGWITGQVSKLPTKTLPLPHVGWNNIILKRPSPLTVGFDDSSDFYFVHSYAFECQNKDQIVATTDYDGEFTSIIQSQNIFGVQFHPEKSQQAGQLLLKNFLQVGQT